MVGGTARRVNAGAGLPRWPVSCRLPDKPRTVSLLDLYFPALFAVLVPALIGALLLIVCLILLRRQRRRRRALRALHAGADALESELKECRDRLERAHAVMAVAPGLPSVGQPAARAAIDAALRALLEHRLWLRDRADTARQRELDVAVTGLQRARAALGAQLAALDSAQRELDDAIRERIHGTSAP